jgi:hypothetical protein
MVEGRIHGRECYVRGLARKRGHYEEVNSRGEQEAVGLGGGR